MQEQNDLRRVESYKKLLAKKEKEALEAEIRRRTIVPSRTASTSRTTRSTRKDRNAAMPKYQNEKSRKARGPPPDSCSAPGGSEERKVPDRPRQQHLHGLTMIIPATVNDVNMHHRGLRLELAGPAASSFKPPAPAARAESHRGDAGRRRRRRGGGAQASGAAGA